MDYSNKDALRKALCEDFNKVGAKVVKVSEFMAAFEKAVKKEYSVFNPIRAIILAQKPPTIDFNDPKVRDKIKAEVKDGNTGIYFDVINGAAVEKQDNAYVDITNLKDMMMARVGEFDINKVPKMFHGQIDNMRKVIIDAANNCPDHTAKIGAGKIKPFVV